MEMLKGMIITFTTILMAGSTAAFIMFALPKLKNDTTSVYRIGGAYAFIIAMVAFGTAATTYLATSALQDFGVMH